MAWPTSSTITRTTCAGAPPFYQGAVSAHGAPTRLLLVVAKQDRLADTQIARQAFERAGEPKQLEVVSGHHFSPYAGAGFTRAAGAAREFFARYL